jgi:hypothetical protein
MGLDQYAHTISKRGQALRADMLRLPTNEERKAFAEETRISDEVQEFCYWRKHADLNEWMTQLAVTRGVVKNAVEFNCTDLVLTLEDIDALEKTLKEDALPHGEGFFWGQSTDADRENDQRFIAHARKAFAEGQQVIYSCWW